METITFTIPVTKESIEFVEESLAKAEKLGFSVDEYKKQVQLFKVNLEISEKEAEVSSLKELKKELEE